MGTPPHQASVKPYFPTRCKAQDSRCKEVNKTGSTFRDDALCAVAGHNLGDAPGELWITQLLHSSDSGRRTKKAPPSGRCPLRRRRTRSGRCPRARLAPWRRACPSGSCPRSGPLRAQPQKQSGCVVALQWCSAAFLVAAGHSAHTRQQAQARMRPEQRLLQKAMAWHDTPCEFSCEHQPQFRQSAQTGIKTLQTCCSGWCEVYMGMAGTCLGGHNCCREGCRRQGRRCCPPGRPEAGARSPHP